MYTALFKSGPPLQARRVFFSHFMSQVSTSIGATHFSNNIKNARRWWNSRADFCVWCERRNQCAGKGGHYTRCNRVANRRCSRLQKTSGTANFSLCSPRAAPPPPGIFRSRIIVWHNTPSDCCVWMANYFILSLAHTHTHVWRANRRSATPKANVHSGH
jgi:hypothetical protein